jgi:monoamine oxidase
MREDGTYDAIVIGAGFAGVTAARDLRDRGRSVLVLEARDRLGGRTWYRTFADTAHHVEFGGTWVCPRWQPHIARELDRYGMELVESPSPNRFGWLLGGELATNPLPIPVEEWLDFERAIVAIDTAAARIRLFEAPLGSAGPDDLDIPFQTWLDALSLPTKTREFLLAWAGFYFGNYPSEVSALHILSWVAGFDNSAVGWYVGVSEKLARGTKGLIDAMAEGSEVRVSSPVRSVEQSGDRVNVTTRGGESFEAAAAIVATPVNTWSDVEFSPACGSDKAAMAAERQAGQSVKIWALVRNLDGNFYGVGSRSTLKWVSTEYTLPEGSLVVGFGCSPEDLDVTDGQAVTAAVREFLPDADVVATDAHDWNADEFSQGTWMAYRPGQVVRLASGIQAPEGRVAFAGSDLAWGWAGWIDGAIESGSRAASEIEGLLASRPREAAAR